MALPLTNTFEGGTNGTTISGPNSGGASGNAFDGIQGTGPTFSSTTPMHGSLGFAPVTTGQSMVTWSTSFGTLTEFWTRFYFRLAGNASTNVPIFYSRDTAATNNVTGVRINTGATGFAITANGSTNVQAFTSTIPTNTWVRFELHSLISGGNATCDGRYFLSPDSTQPTETQTTTIATASTGFAAARYGNNLTQTTAFLFDDLAVSTAGWIGPAAPLPVRPSFTPQIAASTR